MSNINQINGYGNLRAIGQAAKPKGNRGGEVKNSAPASPSVEVGKDQVEISEKSLFLSKMATLPEMRSEKVEHIRKELEQGTYDINGKLSVALDRFMDEYIV